jgi:hypothetical protein
VVLVWTIGTRHSPRKVVLSHLPRSYHGSIFFCSELYLLHLSLVLLGFRASCYLIFSVPKRPSGPVVHPRPSSFEVNKKYHYALLQICASCGKLWVDIYLSLLFFYDSDPKFLYGKQYDHILRFSRPLLRKLDRLWALGCV